MCITSPDRLYAEVLRAAQSASYALIAVEIDRSQAPTRTAGYPPPPSACSRPHEPHDVCRILWCKIGRRKIKFVQTLHKHQYRSGAGCRIDHEVPHVSRAAIDYIERFPRTLLTNITRNLQYGCQFPISTTFVSIGSTRTRKKHY